MGALCCGCWDVRISSRIKEHSVFNKRVVALRFTVSHQSAVLAPQFLTEGTSSNSILSLFLNTTGGQSAGWGGKDDCCS